jgi:hypothetical protein
LLVKEFQGSAGGTPVLSLSIPDRFLQSFADEEVAYDDQQQTGDEDRIMAPVHTIGNRYNAEYTETEGNKLHRLPFTLGLVRTSRKPGQNAGQGKKGRFPAEPTI